MINVVHKVIRMETHTTTSFLKIEHWKVISLIHFVLSEIFISKKLPQDITKNEILRDII
jgi:hypothetical protein